MAIITSVLSKSVLRSGNCGVCCARGTATESSVMATAVRSTSFVGIARFVAFALMGSAPVEGPERREHSTIGERSTVVEAGTQTIASARTKDAKPHFFGD